jgi:adenosylcobinamide-GDP ribazoletransferase
LTIFPVKIKNGKDDELSGASVFFPFVGLLLGLVLAGIDKILLFFHFEQFSSNIILVISLIILTGGLHLDGLSDTIDAFSSNKSKEEMLKIMRDPHIGVMGTLSLISIILLKISLLSSIPGSLKLATLVSMCALSRWSLVFAIASFPYARQEGKAGVFIQGVNPRIFILATMITLVCTIAFFSLKGLLIFGVIAMAAYVINKFINNKISGITGDTLGALCEINEIIVLLSIVILTKFYL